MLLDLIDTVKKRLDQMEEDEFNNPASSISESEEDVGTSDSSDDNSNDSSEGNIEDNDEDGDSSDSEDNDLFENDSITETSDSGICVSDF